MSMYAGLMPSVRAAAEKAAPASAGHRRAKYKKAPGAPKRFKSAFIFFSTEKHKEIRAKMGAEGTAEKTTNVAKLVSEAWRNLEPKEREKWEEMAKMDRARYEEERKNYKGPWKIAVSKKPYKDPNAPKRPMSAFLMYSNGRRAQVKKEHPEFSNGEISRLLSEMWRAAPDEERKKFIKEEYDLRQKYKVDIAKWRKEQEEKERERIQRQEEEELNAPPHRDDMARLSGLLGTGGAFGANHQQQAYLAALGLGGAGGAQQLEEFAMQRARNQFEAEQRARLIAQLGGAGAGSSLMDASASADPYARLAAAAGLPPAGAAGLGQFGDASLLGGTEAALARQAAAAGALRQQQELRQQEMLLQEHEQQAAAAMQAYGQQNPYAYNDPAGAQAVLDAYTRSGAYEQSLADAAAYAQQSSLESQLGGLGAAGASALLARQAAFDPRGGAGAGGGGGNGAGGNYGRSP